MDEQRLQRVAYAGAVRLRVEDEVDGGLHVDIYRLRQRGWTLKSIREEYDIGETTVHRLLDIGEKEYKRKRDKSV